MKSGFYKGKSEKDHTRAADAFPEGTLKEFISNKKLSYTWQHKDVPEFPEIKSGDNSSRLYGKRRA